jgi:eukaryotic-like serine/threonine-protein kinase
VGIEIAMPATTNNRLLGGRYRVGEPLGRGGMGVVWAGRDEALGRDVAIKEVVLPVDLAVDDRETLRRRTLREARAAARISSPAAVTVYDVVEEDGRPWIVMERLAARNLADVLRDDGPLPAHRVAEVGLDLLDALEAAASVGVLHRDVKPGNVLLRSDGRAILTDFGIATVEGDATVTTSGLLLGSPAYMSPERARGERATLASDLWSLGTTLYAALEGRSPFERSGTLPTLSAVLHDPVPQMVGGRELAEVVQSLLVKEPVGRPSLRRVRAALQRIVAREETPLLALGEAANDPRVPRESDATTTTTPHGGTQGAIESWLDRPDERTSTMPRRERRGLSVLMVVGVLIAAGLVGLGIFYDWPSPNPEETRTESRPSARSEPTAESSGRTALPTSQPDAVPPAVSTPADTIPPGAEGQGAGSAGSGGNAGPDAVAAALPDGFHLHTDPTGFTVAVPDGWTRSTDGPRTYFKDPDSGRFLLVDQTTEPKDDPLTDWQANEPSVAARLSGYERISIARVEFRGWNTADWEFTWEGRNGQIHVLNRNIRVSDERAYALYWSVPESLWAESRGMFDVIAQSLEPAP